MTAVIGPGSHKHFGTTVALDGLDLPVRRACRPRLPHGPNGAGGRRRSILPRPAAGDRRPGAPLRAGPVARRRQACTASSPTCPATSRCVNLTGGEAIDLLTRLHGRHHDPGRRCRPARRFDLDPKKGRSCSRATGRRSPLVRGRSPPRRPLLLLDSTTSGRPAHGRVFQEIVRVRDEGARCCSPATSSARSRGLLGRQHCAGRHDRRLRIAHRSRHLGHARRRDLSRRAHRNRRPGTEAGSPAGSPRDRGWPPLTATPPTLEELFLARYEVGRRPDERRVGHRTVARPRPATGPGPHPLSALALTAYSVGSAKATVALYSDAASAMKGPRQRSELPSTLTLYGPATTTSLQGLSIFKTLLMGSVFVGLLAFTIVRRHAGSRRRRDASNRSSAPALSARQAPSPRLCCSPSRPRSSSVACRGEG